jgi:hypothetical protein
MSRTNPDQRLLPDGWLTQYDDKCVGDRPNAAANLTANLPPQLPNASHNAW